MIDTPIRALAEKVNGDDYELSSLAPPDPQSVERMQKMLRFFSRYLRAELRGAEHLPTGPVLMVGNHATWGIDSLGLWPLIREQTGRIPRTLGERALFNTSVGSTFAARLGMVPGTRENALRLLAEGELCLCYPGGELDSFKPWHRRHELQWESGAGYLRVALKAGLPIHTLAAIGADDAYPVLFRDPFVGKLITGRDRYRFPIFATPFGPSIMPLLPFRVRVRCEIGEGIELNAPASLADAPPDDPELMALHHRVQRIFQQRIDDLAARYPDVARQRLASLIRRFVE